MNIHKVNANLDLLVQNNTTGIELTSLTPISFDSIFFATYNFNIDEERPYVKNWYYKDEKYYCLKRLRFILPILKELLGEYISKFMDLDTVKYSIALDSGKIIGLLSKNFRQSNTQYIYACILENKIKTYLKNMVRGQIECTDFELLKSLSNYLIRNYYTNQRDRQSNVLYMSQEEKLSLAPLFDYEASFESPSLDGTYDPVFRHLTNEFLSDVLKHNEIFHQSLEQMLKLDMQKALRHISETYHILIPKEISDYFIDYDAQRKDFIVKSLKK